MYTNLTTDPEYTCVLIILIILERNQRHNLGMSKFKASADDKLGVAEKMRFVLERVDRPVAENCNLIFNLHNLVQFDINKI